MTTDAERISHLEFIAGQTVTALANIQRAQETMRTEIGDLRTKMEAGDAALRTSMEARDTAILAAIGDLRKEMQTADAAHRTRMETSEAALRADMASHLRTGIIVACGIGGAVLVAVIGPLFV